MPASTKYPPRSGRRGPGVVGLDAADCDDAVVAAPEGLRHQELELPHLCIGETEHVTNVSRGISAVGPNTNAAHRNFHSQEHNCGLKSPSFDHLVTAQRVSTHIIPLHPDLDTRWQPWQHPAVDGCW